MPRRQLALTFLAALVAMFAALSRSPAPISAQSSVTVLPPLPAPWPTTFQLGLASQPGDAATMQATAPFGFRYQYLAGGVNTGQGWSTWNPNGEFVTRYIRESAALGTTPVFTYYMVYQSRPGGGDESSAVTANLQNASTMAAYFADLKLFFQRAGASSDMVVLHVEPDMWGYIQQRSINDDASTFPVSVASSGTPDLGRLPDTAAGLAQAVRTLRDLYAPNVVLAYHLSIWGTRFDIQVSQTDDPTTDSLATRAAAFYHSLGADFDLAFAEFSDRDAAFKQHVYGDGGRSWFDADDFRRHARFLSTFSRTAHERLVLWQIPLGNTKTPTANNTWDHYQDNRVETLLDDPTRSWLIHYADAGIDFLFGAGAAGNTTPTTDGGFFNSHAASYYAAGPLSLPLSLNALSTAVALPSTGRSAASAIADTPLVDVE